MIYCHKIYTLKQENNVSKLDNNCTQFHIKLLLKNTPLKDNNYITFNSQLKKTLSASLACQDAVAIFTKVKTDEFESMVELEHFSLSETIVILFNLLLFFIKKKIVILKEYPDLS